MSRPTYELKHKAAEKNMTRHRNSPPTNYDYVRWTTERGGILTEEASWLMEVLTPFHIPFPSPG